MDVQVTVVLEDVQVAAKPRRRTYTAEYNRRILEEADACTTLGAVGVLPRREGLYCSHPVAWSQGVKAEVTCPENTEVRCRLFTDRRVSWLTPRLPPPRVRRVRRPV